MSVSHSEYVYLNVFKEMQAKALAVKALQYTVEKDDNSGMGGNLVVIPNTRGKPVDVRKLELVGRHSLKEVEVFLV